MTDRCEHQFLRPHCWNGACREAYSQEQQAEIDRLRGLMDELHDYITAHDSWRCERYGECRCGLDDLFDRCGWARIPCRPSTDQSLSQHLSHDRPPDREKNRVTPRGEGNPEG